MLSKFGAMYQESKLVEEKGGVEEHTHWSKDFCCVLTTV